MPACGAGQATLLNRKVGRRAGPSPTRLAPRGAPLTRRRLLFLSGLSLLKGFCAPRKVFRDALPARSRGFDRGAPDLFDQLRIREAGRRTGSASSSWSPPSGGFGGRLTPPHLGVAFQSAFGSERAGRLDEPRQASLFLPIQRRRNTTASGGDRESESLARPALPRLFAPDARTSHSCPTKC